MRRSGRVCMRNTVRPRPDQDIGDQRLPSADCWSQDAFQLGLVKFENYSTSCLDYPEDTFL